MRLEPLVLAREADKQQAVKIQRGDDELGLILNPPLTTCEIWRVLHPVSASASHMADGNSKSLV